MSAEVKASPASGTRLPPHASFLFWDTEVRRLAPERYKRYVVERVLQYGWPEDVRWLLAWLPAPEIGAIIRRSRALDRRTANYWALHFGIPREEVTCLQKPSIPALWPP